jgi:integrase
MSDAMKSTFGLVRRPWGVFYLKNKITGAQTSLKTSNKQEAQRLVNARNEAECQPQFNVALARVYLNGADPKLATRTWQEVMEHIVSRKSDSTRARWEVAIKDPNLDGIRNLLVAETRAEHFEQALASGTVSTNVYLRRIHNHALGMEWLLKSVIPRLQWPKPLFKPKRAITPEEHAAIIAREGNPELRAFYQLCWFLGGSQTDVATLCAESVDWTRRTLAYARRKTGTPALIHFGDGVAELLRSLPAKGCLFPRLARIGEQHRGKLFHRRCQLLGIRGVSLHSYRYAWAERALKCGYPERFAQQALGHNSKAVHHAYAKRAEVTVPSLDEWEKSFRTGNNSKPEMPEVKVLPVNFRSAPVAIENRDADSATLVRAQRN